VTYYYIYNVSLILSSVVTVGLFYFVWRRRGVPGSLPLLAIIVACFVWVTANYLQIRGVTLEWQLFFTNLQYFGIVSIPVAWFAFALRFARSAPPLSRRMILLLSIIPLITICLVWTNRWHGLMWDDVRLGQSGPFLVVFKTYGTWFWVFMAYAYGLLLGGALLLLRRVFQRPHLYRNQSIAIVTACLLPIVWNVLYVFRLLPLPQSDLTPSAFTLSALAIAIGVLRYKFLDLVPVARDIVVEQMSDGMLVVDQHGYVVDINAAAASMFNVAESGAFGKHATEVLQISTDEYDQHLSGSLSFYRNPELPKVSAEFHVLPITRHGRALGHLLSFRDVTEREQWQVDLQEKNVQLARADRAKSEFLAAMSHELRTPLNAIMGFTELLLDGISGELNEEQNHCLTDIYNSSQYLLALIEDVLDLSTVEADRMQLQQEPIDLKTVIDEAVTKISSEFRKKHQELVTHIPDDIPMVTGDRLRVQQILINLLINAHKYTGDGGHISVAASYQDKRCRIAVSDNGIGIRKEEAESIFRAFTQSQDNPVRSQRGGAGLGLALSKKLLDRMDGEVWVESTYGQGSTFYFTLPVTDN
jgi:signal transduction histidine kinase